MRSLNHALFAILFATAGAAGCGSGGGALGETPTISGHIQGWSRGQQPLQAGVYGTSSASTYSIIDASGNFSITLPGGAVVGPNLTTTHFSLSGYVGTGCTVTQQHTDPPIDYGSAMLGLGFTDGTGGHGVFEQYVLPNGTTNAVYYHYVDRDWNQTIEQDCPNPKGGVDHKSMDIHYKTGWNRYIVLTIQSKADKIYTGPDPDGATWTFQ